MPFAEQPSEAVPIPSIPLLSEIFPPTLLKWPSNVLFKGWKQPQKQWKEWVDRLAPKYGTVWTEIGIHGAIMSSTYELKRNPELVLALSQFWCPGTNTFVFPWGEATVTLPDVTVLTGLPLVGDSVTSQLIDHSVVEEIVEELEKQRLKLNKSRSKKASHGVWIKNFMEEEAEHQHEHAGFLALWLSRFVFPSLPAETMQNNLFPIAAKLSIGEPVAIGIPFLASIYRDLTAIYNDTMSRKESIIVVAPFQLLQMWILEHFPVLVKGYKVDINPGEPRVARWLEVELDFPFVQSVPQVIRSILEDGDKFVWQPYKGRLENDLNENEQMLFGLQCFELVGLDCSKEKYSPQRVAMQLGMDQDLPGRGFQSNLCSENIGFLDPQRSDQASFSERYIKWWKEMMISRQGVKLEGRYAKFSEYLKKHWSDEHPQCSDSSSSSGESCDESDGDLIPVASSFKVRHGHSPYKESKFVDLENLEGDVGESSSVELVEEPASTFVDLGNGVQEVPAENVEVNFGEGAHGENNITKEVMIRVLIEDIHEGSESASAEKRKKVGESASKSVHLDNGIDKGVPENMEVVVGKIKQGKNGAVKEVKMGLPREAEVIREDSESARAEKRKKVGESASKPSDLDNGKGVKMWDFRKAARELEERTERLEKLLSQVQDTRGYSKIT